MDSEDLFQSATSDTPATSHIKNPLENDLFADVSDEIALNGESGGQLSLNLPSQDGQSPNLDEEMVPSTPPLFEHSASPPALPDKEISLDDDEGGRDSPPLFAKSVKPPKPMVESSHGEEIGSPLFTPPATIETNPVPDPSPATAIFEPMPPTSQKTSSPLNGEFNPGGDSELPFNISAPVKERPKPSAVQDELKMESGVGSATIEIFIKEHEKRGEGMSGFIAYKVEVKVLGNVPGFSKKCYTVWRRFSDFLGLQEKLAEKYLHNGRVVPAAPEKSVMGMTKTKMAKEVEEDSEALEFVQRRRATLERFLKRTVQHPILLQDPDVREFLTVEDELPKSSGTAALSGASVLRFIGKMGDSFNKITYRMDESDQWFEEKWTELNSLEEQLRKLHSSLESMVHYRKEVSASSYVLCKSLYVLAASEDNTALSRAISHLAETQEKVGNTQEQQADKDFYIFAEMLREYIALLGQVKAVFHERVKAWQSWQNAQQSLAKKRENKSRMELAGRTDRIPQAKREVEEAEAKVQECQDHFESISKIIRKEVVRFDAQRISDFKKTLLEYLESLVLTQQQVAKHWESFLPEAKSISST